MDVSGQVWREHRRFSVHVFKELGYGKGSMEDRITDEISYLIKHIDETTGEPMNIHDVLTPSISNNICHLVFGHRLDFNEPKRQAMDRMLDEASKVLSVIGVLMMTPLWLSRLMFKVMAMNKPKKFIKAFDVFKYELIVL
jgi:hypothetical protein